MPRKPIPLREKLKEILKHSQGLPPEAAAPHSHYTRSVTDLATLLEYIERNLGQLPSLRPAVMERHLAQLTLMLLVHLIESFERYLKEVAASCIDLLGAHVLDDRFDGFRVQGSVLAVHFATDTLGQALCESSTWLDTNSINNRFRDLLADPFQAGNFILFPNPKPPHPDRERYENLNLVWQLRHTVVHNVGVITQSDAIKFRVMVKEEVSSPRLLTPTRDDIRYLKRFLNEMVETCNEKIGKRISEVLTLIHQNDPSLFVPREMADRVTAKFGFALVVAGAIGVLPPS